MDELAPITIDVVSDVVCPWCYVGQKRLDRALSMAPKVTADIRWRPFQLDPTIPPRGTDRRDYMMAKFGSMERVEPMHARLEELGAVEGIEFDFKAIKVSPNTLDAHRLIRWAGAAGNALQGEVVRRLFSLYFEEGADIGDRALLVDVAREAGMDAAVVDNLLAAEADTDAVRQEIDTASADGHHRRSLLPARKPLRGDGCAGGRSDGGCDPQGGGGQGEGGIGNYRVDLLEAARRRCWRGLDSRHPPLPAVAREVGNDEWKWVAESRRGRRLALWSKQSVIPDLVSEERAESVGNPGLNVAAQRNAMSRIQRMPRPANPTSKSERNYAASFSTSRTSCVITTAAPDRRFSGVAQSRMKTTDWSGLILASTPCSPM